MHSNYIPSLTIHHNLESLQRPQGGSYWLYQSLYSHLKLNSEHAQK